MTLYCLGDFANVGRLGIIDDSEEMGTWEGSRTFVTSRLFGLTHDFRL